MTRSASVLVTSAALLAAPPASGSLCDDIAAKLRADAAFGAAGSQLQPLDALAKQGFAEIATSSDADSDLKDSGAYVRSLVAKYKMDPALGAAVKDMALESDQVWSLKASPVHAFSDTGGTAHCATFLFFAGGHKLPDPPWSMDGGMSDEDQGPIVECYRSEGSLARIGGRIAFTATDSDMPRSHDVTLSLATLTSGKWGAACAVEASFPTLYRVKHVFRAKDAPLSRAEVAGLAPQIARARDQAAGKRFAFGPPLAAADKKRLETLAKALPDSQDDVPSFGAKIEAGEIANVGNDSDDLPASIGGKPYLVRIGHPSIGWRDLLGYALVFYRAEGDRLVPMASVILDEQKGRLAGIKAEMLP